jgi:hypothetical protein
MRSYTEGSRERRFVRQMTGDSAGEVSVWMCGWVIHIPMKAVGLTRK